MQLRSFPLVLLPLIVLIVVAAAAEEPPRTLDEIRRDGELVMLTFPHQESVFSRTNLELGPMPRSGPPERFVGIDIDLVHAFARRLGVDLVVRPVSEPRYAALIPDLLAGRGDLVASSFSITDERRRLVDFSRPYFTVYPVIVTRGGAGIRDVGDLDGLVGATTSGSSHETRLRQLGVPEAALLHVDFSAEAYGAVLDGDADFTLADSVSAHRFLAGSSSLEIAFRLPDEDHYAVAVAKGSELLAELETFLAEVEASGELEAICASHLGPTDRRSNLAPRLAVRR